MMIWSSCEILEKDFDRVLVGGGNMGFKEAGYGIVHQLYTVVGTELIGGFQ